MHLNEAHLVLLCLSCSHLVSHATAYKQLCVCSKFPAYQASNQISSHPLSLMARLRPTIALRFGVVPACAKNTPSGRRLLYLLLPRHHSQHTARVQFKHVKATAVGVEEKTPPAPKQSQTSAVSLASDANFLLVWFHSDVKNVDSFWIRKRPSVGWPAAPPRRHCGFRKHLTLARLW